jgi:hypothetical protein
VVKLPQYKEPFISQVVPDQTAGQTGQLVSQAGDLLLQTGDIMQQRQLANDMTKVSEMSADLELQLYDDLDALKEQKQDNPEGFMRAFDEIIKTRKNEFINNSDLSFAAKQSFNKIVDSLRTGFAGKSNQFEETQQIKNFASNVENAAEKNNLLAYRFGQNLDLSSLDKIEAAVNANVLAGSSFVPKAQLDTMYRTQTEGAYTDWFNGSIETDPYRALELLDSKQFDEKLGSDNLQALRTKAIKRIEILENENEKANKKLNSFIRAARAMKGEILLDPKTSDDVKAADIFWEFQSLRHDEENADVNTRIEDAKMISEKLGIIPAQVQTATSAMLFNGSPEQQALSADFISDITINRPRIAEQYDDKTRAFAQAVTINLNAGIDQKKAVEWARDGIDINQKKSRDVRIEEYKGKKNAKEVQKDIETMKSDLEPFFGSIDIPESLISDFATLQEGYFINEHVDRNTAFDLAKKDIQNLYAVTEIGKKRYMKYAPEAFYGREIEDNYGVKPNWIKRQVIKKVFDTEDRIFESEKKRREFIDNISLNVNPDSIIGGNNPTYYIFSENEFGGLDLVLDKNNRPLEYVPEFKETEEYKKIEEEYSNIQNSEDVRKLIKEARDEKRYKDKILRQLLFGGLPIGKE